jgi:hypothetical protein
MAPIVVLELARGIFLLAPNMMLHNKISVKVVLA